MGEATEIAATNKFLVTFLSVLRLRWMLPELSSPLLEIGLISSDYPKKLAVAVQSLSLAFAILSECLLRNDICCQRFVGCAFEIRPGVPPSVDKSVTSKKVEAILEPLGSLPRIMGAGAIGDWCVPAVELGIGYAVFNGKIRLGRNVGDGRRNATGVGSP